RAERVLNVVCDARRHVSQESHLRLLRQFPFQLNLVGDEPANFQCRREPLRQELQSAELLPGKIRGSWSHLEHGDDFAAAVDLKASSFSLIGGTGTPACVSCFPCRTARSGCATSP